MFSSKNKDSFVIKKDIADKFEKLIYSVHLKVSQEELTERDRLYSIQVTNIVSRLLLGGNFNYVVNIYFIKDFKDEYNNYFRPLKNLLDKYGYFSLYG